MTIPESADAGFERPPPDEADWISRTLELQARLMQAGLRAQHPKAHGCLEAEFRIRPDLPAEVRHGIFGASGVRRAWVRVSSAFGFDDREPDFHGFAIKLPGGGAAGGDQDFLLIDAPAFFVPDVRTLYGFFSRQLELRSQGLSPAAAMQALAAEYPEAVRHFQAWTRPALPPLVNEYWSCVPFRLGPHAVKYHLRPDAGNGPPGATPGSAGYARQTLVEWLTDLRQPARFEFRVQVCEDPATMPIEDATAEWPSPFQAVAEVFIPPQDFANPERDALGDDLSFDPWHARPEHRPLGGLNRARRSAYPDSAGRRHAARAAAPADRNS